jgi:CDP-paratose 2-epimerase
VLCVEDLVRAIEGVRANMALTGGQVYNVGGGLENSISLLELVDEIERMTGKRLHYELRKTRPGDQPVYITDYSKLQQHIGWKPSVSVRETLKQIYDWSHNNQGILRTELPHVSISMAPSERIPEAAS